MDVDEEWKSMNSLGLSKYAISNFGRVKNVLRCKILKGTTTADGYKRTGLYDDDGCMYSKLIHTLVALIFIPNPDH